MKKTVKIISAICAIVMLIGILPVMSVFAEEPATEATLVVTPSAENVFAGQEFTITVSLENNPGVWAVNFQLPFDAEAFECVSYDAKTNTILSDGSGMCGTNDSFPDIFQFNMTYNDYFSNVTEDGALVVITFKAKENAELGKYTFATEVIEKNCIDKDGGVISIADASAEVEIVDIETAIDSASIVLGADISVKYYVTLSPEHVGAEMKFTYHGEEITVAGEATGNAFEYAYTFKGIAPQCMGDNLKAELVFDGNVVAEKAEYSVLANCNHLLNTYADNAAVKTLVADLLIYGAKAQLFTGYNTDALVDAELDKSLATEFVAPEDLKFVEESDIEEVALTAAGVYFDYTTSLFIKFTAPGRTEEDFKIVLENDDTGEAYEYTLADCELIDEATSTYFLKMADVSVTSYDDLYIIELQRLNGTRWKTFQEAEYSVGSYVYAMQDNENTAMADLAKALYNYGVSAANYNA